MANMSYCRFQNTASDLSDCLEHLNDDLSDDEHRARRRLLVLCVKALNVAGFDFHAHDAIAEAKRVADEMPVSA